MKCIAIDDEPIALKIIEQFCRRVGDIQLKTFTNAHEGLNEILRSAPELVFLDIEMGEMSGLQIAAKISGLSNVVFTTAYLNYAIDGFNLDAVDYLHKPFSFARFSEAIEKAKRRLASAPKAPDQGVIYVKREYSNIPVDTADILYVKAMENYSSIFLNSGKKILAHLSLKRMEELLPPDRFLRIHKSYIVSRKEIISYNRQHLHLSDSTLIPVGRHYADLLKSK